MEYFEYLLIDSIKEEDKQRTYEVKTFGDVNIIKVIESGEEIVVFHVPEFQDGVVVTVVVALLHLFRCSGEEREPQPKDSRHTQTCTHSQTL